MNICKNCKYGNVGRIWYDSFCKHPAVERVPTCDPVTGKQTYSSENDLGTTIFDDQRHPYCRDINTEGECEYYER